MSRVLIVVLCALALLDARRAAGDTTAEAQRPNVLVLVADDMRPDAIAALGHPQVKTPHLDALVRAGVSFRRASCANPLCVPSRAEMLSGRTSFRNGFFAKGSLSLDGPPTWAETMRRGGYRTYYVGKWHTSGRPSTRGYDESMGLYAGGAKPEKPQLDHAGRIATGYVGWVFQTDDGKTFPERGVGLTPTISADFADAAIDVLRRKHKQPFLLHVNFTAPHDPRLLPPGFARNYPADRIQLPRNFRAEHPFDHGNRNGRDEKLLALPRRPDEVRAEIAAYYAVIEHLDQQLGRILTALRATGLADDTIVLFTSDHGLALGSHGLVGKQNTYEHTINVPLIFRGPGIPKGQTRKADCYLRDLYPTVCELTGITPPKGLDGRSLVPVLRGDKDAIYPFITGYFYETQRMIRQGRWKYVAYPAAGREQLLDLQSDPEELHDLSADPAHVARRKELRALLRRWLEEQGDAVARKL